MKRLFESVSPTDSNTLTLNTNPLVGPSLRYTTLYVEVFQGTFATVVVVFELIGNQGKSVTNAAEMLYAYMKQRYSKDLPMFMFESYYLMYDDEDLSAVIVGPSPTPFSSNRVTFKHASKQQVERVIKGVIGVV